MASSTSDRMHHTPSYVSLGALIAEEIYDAEHGYASGPERALLVALLFDGVTNFLNYTAAQKQVERVRYQEAFSWVMRHDEEYVFSFENVCEGLGIDPEALRLGLVNAAHSGAWRKRRREA